MNVISTIKKLILFITRNIYFKKVTVNISNIPLNQLLKNKIALITGGSSGIGFAIAEGFIKSGASVVIAGRNEKKLDIARNKLSVKCNNQNKVWTINLDITDVACFQEKIDHIIKECGKIDILVNNAGMLGSNLTNTTDMDYTNVMNTNLKGAFFLSREIANYMIKNHIHGNILNICSSSSLRPANSAYTLSKWGLRGLTLGLAKTLCKHNITVNGIAPGPTATEMLGQCASDRIDNKYSPIGRMALPEEIANMAIFLVSNMGRTIVGDIIYMTGGAGLITFDDANYEI